MKIGFFDSGFGGLAALRAVVHILPQYDYVYFGDSLHAPYGDRSRDEVYHLTRRCIEYLFANNCSLVIIACNTASADALRRLQKETTSATRRLLGITVPLVEEAIALSRTGRIGILATRGTVASNVFQREITARNPDACVVQQACPALVPLIESGREESPAFRVALRRCVMPLRAARVDTVILGCTHYELARSAIATHVMSFAEVSRAGTALPVRLARYLSHHEDFARKLSRNGTRTFLTTDANVFDRHAARFFGMPIASREVAL